jgi:tetratricopeptide (TPR) repeat protein
MTMVHVALGRLDLAEQIARQGIEEQDRQTKPGHRFPAVGFHWLLGALEATRGRFPEAVAEFNRELGLIDVRRLYGHEYGAMALTSRGMAELALGRAAGALTSFREARSHVAGFGRAHLGEALALEAQGDAKGAIRARQDAIEAERDYQRTGRVQDAHYLAARIAASSGKTAEAVKALNAVFDAGPPSFHGWTMPIDPFLAPLADRPDFRSVLARLQERAR